MAITGVSQAVCEFKSEHYQLMVVRLHAADLGAVQAFVADQVSAAPQLLEGVAVAVDLSALQPVPNVALLEDLLQRLRFAGVQPIALVAEPDSALADLAQRAQLAVVTSLRRERVVLPEPASAPVAVMAQVSTTIVPAAVHTPAPAIRSIAAQAPLQQPALAAASVLAPQRFEGQVRSGQQVYANARDLIVCGTVGAGSEVIADGSVHVYGRLIGKVIAGALGDRGARIYCLAFGAELVSIAGVFRVFERIPVELRGQALQIRLDGEKLLFETLGV